MNATKGICIAETTNRGCKETKEKRKNKETKKNRSISKSSRKIRVRSSAEAGVRTLIKRPRFKFWQNIEFIVVAAVWVEASSFA